MLNLETLQPQEGTKGRPFRNTSVERVPDTTKWIGKDEKSIWLHTFKYLDDGTTFTVEVDYYGKIKKI